MTWQPTAARAVSVVVAGACLSFAFAPRDLWWLAPLSVTVLTLAVHGVSGRRGLWLGLSFGMAFMLPLLTWIKVIGSDAWVYLSLLEALFYGLLGVGLAGISSLIRPASAESAPAQSEPEPSQSAGGRPPTVARLLVLAVGGSCWWVLAEALAARIPFGGFPWGRLAFAQANSPALGLAALGGSPLVSAAVALSGGLLAVALLHARSALTQPRTQTLTRAGVLVVAAVLIPALGALVPRIAVAPVPGDKTLTIAVVQGNVPTIGMDAFGQPRVVLNNHLAATHELAAQVRSKAVAKPDLVVWPESASDIDPFRDARGAADIAAAVADIGVTTLVGASVLAPDQDTLQNSMIAWDPITGPGQRYIKQHLVPFGEYIPLRGLIARYSDRLDRISLDFAAGSQPGRFQVAGTTVGGVLCFDIAYDQLVRNTVLGGLTLNGVDAGPAQVLVVGTNNATYGLSGQPEQQLAITRLRAVEHGRAVFVASTSGISAVIAPDGSILSRTKEFTRATLESTVALRTQLTIADRLGDLPELILVLGALLVSFLARRERNRAAVRHTGIPLINVPDGSTGGQLPATEPAGSVPGAERQ